MVWFDSYAAAVSLLCSALFEALAIVYGYGKQTFRFESKHSNCMLHFDTVYRNQSFLSRYRIHAWI